MQTGTVSRLTLREILRIRNLHQMEHCAFWKSYICSNKLTCKKQTAVSHISTESEIISLDTGLRLHGLLALELWDLIISVFGSVTQTSDRTARLFDTERSQKSQGKINVMENIDSVPSSNVQSSRQEALMYVFEDNGSSDQDDHLREESCNETRFQNPQSCT